MKLSSRTQVILAIIPMLVLLIIVVYTNFYTDPGKLKLWKFSERDATVEEEPLFSILRRLVTGRDRTRFEETGFACHSDLRSDVCVSSNPVTLQAGEALNLYVTAANGEFVRETVRPYPRKHEEFTMKTISPVEISSKKSGDLIPSCEVNHSAPTLVFSIGGFTGNLFHEFNEVIVPLFITARHFRSNLKLVITDYRPWMVSKYRRIFSHLARHGIVNPTTLNGTVHCFPGAVVGMKFHGLLALNSSDIPGNHTMSDFRLFLIEAYDLRANPAPGTGRPVLLLLSRPRSRVFLNEDEMAEVMTKLGFDVVVATPYMLSNLDKASGLIHRCSVMVGAHGAGLTNAVFLPDRAVVVQVVPLGLDWASTAYFGTPVAAMGLQYLEYKVVPEESSLLGKYGRDDPVIADPETVFKRGYEATRAIYVDGQNLRINLDRFRETMVRAMELLGPSHLPLD